jgi:dihydrofolate reductase
VRPQRALIVAVSPEGAIGLHGKIPWKHPGDLRRFKRLTLGAAVIMGRATWESMGSRPLPGRRNVVVTSGSLAGVECHPSIESALAACQAAPVWFIGGARVYAEAMRHADLIDVTYVPERVDHPEAIHFPAIDPAEWEEGPLVPHEDEPELTRREYRRRVAT